MSILFARLRKYFKAFLHVCESIFKFYTLRFLDFFNFHTLRFLNFLFNRIINPTSDRGFKCSKGKIYQQLIDWKKITKGKKAIQIEGAKRIGKSTIVEEFAKINYRSYILIDFSKTSQIIKDAFNNMLN